MERFSINSAGGEQGLETAEVLKCSDGPLPPSALFYIKLVHVNWTGKTEQCSHNSWPDSANLTKAPSPWNRVSVGSWKWVRDDFVALSVPAAEGLSKEMLVWLSHWCCRRGSAAEEGLMLKALTASAFKSLLIPSSQQESSHSTGQRYTSRKV